mmetsp:Transcript_15218/g.34946  ORF Transcript_15218/g.34946 Transcript_15218/m.34946 type:complete len:212 (-) Transcript_15218:641-1276(-)
MPSALSSRRRRRSSSSIVHTRDRCPVLGTAAAPQVRLLLQLIGLAHQSQTLVSAHQYHSQLLRQSTSPVTPDHILASLRRAKQPPRIKTRNGRTCGLPTHVRLRGSTWLSARPKEQVHVASRRRPCSSKRDVGLVPREEAARVVKSRPVHHVQQVRRRLLRRKDLVALGCALHEGRRKLGVHRPRVKREHNHTLRQQLHRGSAQCLIMGSL